MLRKLAASLLLTGALIAPAAAETIRVVDGDTLAAGQMRFRLQGIDAPEKNQQCADGWRAGHAATAHLIELIGDKVVRCEISGYDKYHRALATCSADGIDLNAAMVQDGFALAYVHYSRAYVTQEAMARATHAGLHAHECMAPWDWRHRK